MKGISWAKLSVLMLSMVLLVASATHARHTSVEEQQPPPQTEKPPTGQAPAGQQAQQPRPETLQLLKGMPRQQIMQEMRKIAAGLGVECNFCHVNPFSVDTPRKAVARLMMRDYTMAMQHKDNSALTCNDCHKGQPNPLRTRPFDGAVGKKAPEVLKGMSEAQVTQVMTAFTKALGVECNYCHTSDFDDDTPRKQIARFMMTEYSRGLTKKDGSTVTCNDCHQGHARPLAVLAFPRREQNKPEPEPAKKPGDFHF
ncbi:MAG TPA: photosynthetic reaction center cytochrome c subunit family protein [Blastocatellia bacterium]|nr:photosynthetic reaction center cytochrome c subunit family protein [Blastocatellia bacterium]